jgi:hypothetical protein
MSKVPSVTVKVSLDKLVSGVQLLDAIHKVVTQHNQAFQAVGIQQTVSQGFLIGQASSTPYKQLRVSPSVDEEVVSTQRFYSDFIVTTHSWDALTQYAIDDEECEAEAQRYIPSFANELKEVLQTLY